MLDCNLFSLRGAGHYYTANVNFNHLKVQLFHKLSELQA